MMGGGVALQPHFLPSIPARTPVQNDIRELLICMMDRFCNGKTSNIASSPQWLSGPLHVVKLGGPMDDKFITCTHEQNWHFNRPKIIRHAHQKLAIIYQGTTIFPSIKQTLSQLPIIRMVLTDICKTTIFMWSFVKYKETHDNGVHLSIFLWTVSTLYGPLEKKRIIQNPCHRPCIRCQFMRSSIN